jgi:hypothetical protein
MAGVSVASALPRSRLQPELSEMIFPYPAGWERIARRTCENLNRRHALCSDLWDIVEPWTRPESSAAPSERYDSNKLMAAGALVVNCSRVCLALFRGDDVELTTAQPLREFESLKREADRRLGDISRWVADDVRSVVVDAAVLAVLAVEGEFLHSRSGTQECWTRATIRSSGDG